MNALLPLVASLLLQDPAPLHEMVENELAAQSEGVDVQLVSKDGEPELLDVVAHGAPAHEVLARLAQKVHRSFKLDPGETVLRANQPIDVHLKRRTLRECAAWIAGAAGLGVELNRRELRCIADVAGKALPEQMLQNAMDGWRLALLADPLQPDAARLRFQIANALYQLGDFARAIVEYVELEKNAQDFSDLAFAYLRCGHAYAKLGDDSNAVVQWLAIGSTFPRHALVAPARLEAVRALRRLGDVANANMVLRGVVETLHAGLTPDDLVVAGELIDEGGDSKRALETFQWALQSISDPALEERALLGLARAQAGLEDWPGVVATAEHFLKQKNDGPAAGELDLLLARAHAALGDPFTALLAIARARELKAGGDLALRGDLLEGEIFADCGLTERAEKPLVRAAASENTPIAARALLVHSKLLRADGQLEAAARLLARLAALPGHEAEGQIALAEIALQQKNPELCLTRVKEALPKADAKARARLLEIAADALHGSEGSAELDALLESLSAPPVDDAAAPAPAPESAKDAPAAAPSQPADPNQEKSHDR